MSQRTTADDQQIGARLRGVMSAVFGIDATAIAPAASSSTIAEWDSVRHLQLMMALEDEFGIQFEAEELASLRSFAALEQRLSRDSEDV